MDQKCGLSGFQSALSVSRALEFRILPMQPVNTALLQRPMLFCFIAQMTFAALTEELKLDQSFL